MCSSRKPSLFAQMMQKLPEVQVTDPSSVPSDCRFGNHSYIVTSKEADAIHSENVALLSSMSQKEIEEKQKELLQNLDASNVKFLRNRRKKQAHHDRITNVSWKSEIDSHTFLENKCQSCDLQSSHPMDTDMSQSCKETEKSIIDLELRNKGIHMDIVESEKLKWMEDVPSIMKPFPDSLYNARFDFEGNLLPYIEEGKSTCDKGLYHHGEEPQRPGYAIEELYQLTRSSLPSQRIVALNTLAAILEKEFILSACLETELLKRLVESGIFLIIRFALDDKLKPVYLAALRAMSALLWRPLDMHYLSDMVGTYGDMQLPTSEVDYEILASENQHELRDIELLKVDLIKGALRTDIVQRFRYLIDDPLLEIEHYISIIKCLTRIAYHSDEAVDVILTTTSLIEMLFLNCQFPVKFDKLYIAKVMILFRVIACRSAKFAATLVARLNLVPFLLSIIGDAVTKTSTASQCIYLWHVLLHQGLASDSVSELSPTFFILLNQLFSIQIDNLESGIITFATALIILLTFLFDHFGDIVRFLVPTLERLCCQWINVIEKEERLPREFIKLTANMIHFLTHIRSINVPLWTFHAKLIVLVETSSYRKLINELQNCSYLLNANKRNFVASLPSLCIPATILHSRNSFLLVHSILKYDLNFNDHIFDLNDHILSYITSILNHSTLLEVTRFWPARFEIAFLCNILSLCCQRQVFMERRLLQLAFTLVRIIHVDDASRIENIFCKVLFNAHVYQNIIVNDNRATDVFVELESIEQFFARELCLPKTNATLMSTKRGTESALPTDWYYVPILRISNAKSNENVDVGIIKPALRWIYLIEYMSDDIKIDISLSARYCRVSCVFFCGDVFLEVTDILYDILREITKRNDRLEFKKPIPGITSFYDFYRELCEQFVSTSYCNPVFGAYMLIPLQQKHDCRLRQYVWMEQAIMLRFLTIKLEELLVSIDCYLKPCETNLQLIETYLRTIATGRINDKTNPVVYRIGFHHVATFVRIFSEEAAAEQLRQRIENLGNVELRNKFLNYNYTVS